MIRNLLNLALWYVLFTIAAYSMLLGVTGDWITAILPALVAGGAGAIVLAAMSFRVTVHRDTD